MPCEDQTEYLEMVFDQDDKLTNFQLRKKTCGKSVGYESILPLVERKSLDELMEMNIDGLLSQFDKVSRVDEFLAFKQWFSLQSAGRVILGMNSGEKKESFALDFYDVGPKTSKIAGFISVDVVSEEIKACGKCKGCPTKKKAS